MNSDPDMVAFGRFDIGHILSRMDCDAIDKLPFGAIQIDASGTILHYNATEGLISGRDPKTMIGQNLFTEVAPCTNRPEFRGVFESGVEDGNLSSLIEYIFYNEATPIRVKVHMKKASVADKYWIFVKRL